MSIVRDTIVQRQVETRELAGGAVTYVRVAGISDNAAASSRRPSGPPAQRGVTKFVVDLRDNPGGFVTGARSIASQFIADGPIFWEEAADGSQVATNAAAGGLATGADVRVAVLVNGGTASASEMIAGALQDTGRGTLIGETTFGKGTIQQWIDLTAESGGFRLSIARWLTPDKRWIHEEGLGPDVAVPADGAGAGEPRPHGRSVRRRGARPLGPRRRRRTRLLSRAGLTRPRSRRGRGRGSAPARFDARTIRCLARSRRVLYVSPDRKEVMCSDRQ